MHYGELKKCDIANGTGVRVTLFVSGCTNHCPDCFQPQTWDFDYGKEFTGETKAEIFAELDSRGTSGSCCRCCGRYGRSTPIRRSGASPASVWTTSC